MRAAYPLSSSVRALAEAVRGAHEPDRQSPRIDEPLVALAVRRHRVGPLLNAAAQRGTLDISNDLSARLARDAAANARRAAIGRLLQSRVVRSLAEAGIPSLVFKGLPLAEQLYGDPSWRHFGDLDVLVRPRDFRAASAALSARAILASDGEMPAHGPLAAMSAQLLRDVHLRDAASGLRVELHQRLFFVEPGGAQALWHASFAPRLPATEADIPAPPTGANLAFYLLLHGAISGWWRMKWLADLHLLVSRLSGADAAELAATAETCRTARSIKASLILLRDLFRCPLPAPLDAWIAETSGARGVSRRLSHYTRLLNEPRAQAPSPAHSRTEALRSLLFLLEPAPQRLDAILRGSLATGLRVAAKRAQL